MCILTFDFICLAGLADCRTKSATFYRMLTLKSTRAVFFFSRRSALYRTAGMLLPINLIIDTSVKEGLKGQVTYAIRSEVRSATKELAAKLRTAAGPGKMTKDQSIEAAKKLIKGAQAANATEVQAAIKITSTGVEVGVTSFEGGIIEELKSEILDNENE